MVSYKNPRNPISTTQAILCKFSTHPRNKPENPKTVRLYKISYHH